MTAVLDDARAEQKAHLLARVRSLAWLDAQTFPPLQWAVPGLIPEGFGLLVGPPKLGKSWFALSVGLSISLGGRALGHIDCDQRPVFYAALEDGDRRLQDRARRLMAGQALPAAFEYTTAATPLEILPMLDGWLDEHPEGVCLLDTLGRVMPPALPGENQYQRDYRIGAHLKAVTDTHPGSSLVVVHHVRKAGSEDWMEATSGTNGLNGSADFTVSLTRTRNEMDAVIRVTGRDVREDEYAATISDGSWRLSGTDLAAASRAAKELLATAGLGDDSAKVVDFITGHPQGATANEVATHMGWSDGKARTYLTRLADSGRVSRASRGLYRSVSSVSSVSFDDTDDPNDTQVTLDTLGTT